MQPALVESLQFVGESNIKTVQIKIKPDDNSEAEYAENSPFDATQAIKMEPPVPATQIIIEPIDTLNPEDRIITMKINLSACAKQGK